MLDWADDKSCWSKLVKTKLSVKKIIFICDGVTNIKWLDITTGETRCHLTRCDVQKQRGAISLVMYYSAFSLLIFAVFIINPRGFGFLLFSCWITTSKILMVFLWIRTLRFAFSLHTWGLNFQGMLFPCWTLGASSFWMCPTSCLCSKISITNQH